MATVVNDRDVLLLGILPSQRQSNPAGSTILLTTNTSTFHVSTDGVTTPSYITVTAHLLGITGTVAFTASGTTITDNHDNTATIAYDGMSGASASVTATIVSNGTTFTSSVTITKVNDGATGPTGPAGTPANQYAIAYLYQWSTSAPSAPVGSSTFDWASATNTNYVGSDSGSWKLSPPANPGAPNISLFVAAVQISATGGTLSSTVSYTNAVISAWAQNGATGAQGNPGTSGVQSASPTVFQWAASIPAGPSGSATYTWSDGTFGAAPSGWSLTAGNSPTQGMTLWAAKVQITDVATNSTTAFNWTSASISAVGYAGSNGGAGAQGASYVTAYCASATPTTTTAPAQTTGKTSLPATNDGGITGTWSATVPTLSSGQYMYQSDGIYDPTTNKVTWSIPYWSSLKVGSLSAITTNTGNLTVSGTISSANGNFTVDAAGNATMRSASIQDSSGNIILQAGSYLADAYVPPSAQNSQLTPSITAASLSSFSPYSTWEFTGSLNGWSAGNASITSNANSITVTATTSDPNLYAPTGLSIPGAKYDKVRMRVRRLAGSGWQGQLYYSTSGHGLDELHTKIISDTTIGGAWTVLEWDMANLTTGGTDWTSNTITGLRFDLGASATDSFEVDWVSVGRYGVNSDELNSGISSAATTATWNGITGTGKPEDNATVGATLGTNVSGQITNSNSSTLVGTGAINSVHISDLRTTNYAEDGSGNPTAGGKLSSTGTAFKVAANSMQVGTQVLSDYWFRLLQGVDGNISNGRVIWRGNNDATTRGGAPNIACLSVVPKPAMVDFTTNNLSQQWQGDASGRLTVYHSYILTPTSYSGNTDNLDAMSQIHVQFFAKPTDLSPFIELYAACPSRTYDGATGAVRGTWALGFYFSGNSLANSSYPPASNPNLSGSAPNVVFDTNNGGGQYVYIGYLRIRIANTYGWSATQDFAPNGTRVVGSNSNTYQNNATLPTGTITGVAGSSGGGSGSQGGACPAPWVKVRLLNGKEVNAGDLHNGAKLAAVNDSTMEALPQGGIVRDLATIWKQRYRVKLTDGTATEWSENHRFAVVERGWVQVQNLRSGDQILGLKEAVVESVLAVGEGQVVSFRVEGAGTYFAGGLLCHNTKTIT